MSKVDAESKCIFLGKTKSGKSYAIRDLLSYHTDIPVGTVINCTELANRFYSDMVPGRFISDKYTPELIANFMKRQFAASKRAKDDARAPGGKAGAAGAGGTDPRAFLIMDDCLHDNSWTRDENIRYLFFAGRHVHTLFLLASQYPLGIPPSLRGNIQYVFIFREPVTANRKRIYESYAGMFPTFEMFCQVMDQCTEDYHCLVLDNTTTSNKLEDQVFWYRAEEKPAYRLCDPELWKDNKPFVSSLAIAKDEEDWDPTTAKRGPTVWVKKTKY